jgi:hypothetical protein
MLFVVALLTCVAAARAQSDLPFSLHDERPEAEKKTHFHSLMITNCNYGVRRIGDADIVPAPLEQMRTGLVETFGDRLAGRDLKVRRYTVDVNTASATRATMGRQYTGLIPSLMLSAGAQCPREKMEAGWYAAEEVTTPNSPLIVDVQLELDGQSVAIRSVYSPPDAWEPRVWKPQSRAQVNAALSSAQAKLVAALEPLLPNPVATDATHSPAAEPAGSVAPKPN